MKQIFDTRLVPAATVDDADAAVPLAEALLSGGLPVLEITFRTPVAAAAIRAVAEHVPDMLIGAGTILTGEELQEAIDAGIRFGVAPGLNPGIVRAAAERGVRMIPGVATPSEIDHALAMGCTLLKFFPAGPLGGVPILKAMAAPFVHKGVRFVPTGGVNASNAADYLALPEVAAVGGSWMVKRELIAARDWPAISALAREAVALAKS